MSPFLLHPVREDTTRGSPRYPSDRARPRLYTSSYPDEIYRQIVGDRQLGTAAPARSLKRGKWLHHDMDGAYPFFVSWQTKRDRQLKGPLKDEAVADRWVEGAEP